MQFVHISAITSKNNQGTSISIRHILFPNTKIAQRKTEYTRNNCYTTEITALNKLYFTVVDNVLKCIFNISYSYNIIIIIIIHIKYLIYSLYVTFKHRETFPFNT